MARFDDRQGQKADAAYFRDAMRQPLLERDHELGLARRWRDQSDERALHELVRSYARLVIALAGRFRSYGLPVGDLVQEGNVGLMQAAQRFDPDREVRFSTYASWWIRSSMQDYVLRNWSIVRIGTSSAQKTLFFNLRRLRAKLQGAAGGAMTDDARAAIAVELGVPLRDVEAMEVRLLVSDQSLNAPIAEGGEDHWQDVLADDRPGPEDVVAGMRDARSRSAWLALALADLSPRERLIIDRRRLREEGDTLDAVGRDLGISKERVRQLENRAMSKLRERLRSRVERVSDLYADA